MAGTVPQNVAAGDNPGKLPDCSTGNAKPTLSMSYEVRGPDYLHFILNGNDKDNDSLVYGLNITDASGNPVGTLSQNPDKSFTWTYTTGYVKYVNAVASVSDMRDGQVCSTVTENETIQAVIHNTEGNVTGA